MIRQRLPRIEVSNEKQGWRDSSAVVNSTFCFCWGPKYGSQDPQGRKRDSTPTIVLWPPHYMHACACAHRHLTTWLWSLKLIWWKNRINSQKIVLWLPHAYSPHLQNTLTHTINEQIYKCNYLEKDQVTLILTKGLQDARTSSSIRDFFKPDLFLFYMYGYLA